VERRRNEADYQIITVDFCTHGDTAGEARNKSREKRIMFRLDLGWGLGTGLGLGVRSDGGEEVGRKRKILGPRTKTQKYEYY
jgi:hypothetical protein